MHLHSQADAHSVKSMMASSCTQLASRTWALEEECFLALFLCFPSGGTTQAAGQAHSSTCSILPLLMEGRGAKCTERQHNKLSPSCCFLWQPPACKKGVFSSALGWEGRLGAAQSQAFWTHHYEAKSPGIHFVSVRADVLISALYLLHI